MITLCFIHQ